MKKYARRGVSDFPADDVKADALTAHIRMEKDGQEWSYKPGDFVIMFSLEGETKLAFMSKQQFRENFEAPDPIEELEGTDDSPPWAG